MPSLVVRMSAALLFLLPSVAVPAEAKGPPEKLQHSATPAEPAKRATPADPKSGTPARPAVPANPAIPPFGSPPPVSNN